MYSYHCLIAFAVLFGHVHSQFFGERTCVSRCGQGSAFSDSLLGQCSCHPECEVIRNCCNDYFTYCVTSCVGICGRGYHPLFSCQCMNNCTGDVCCEDYKSVCIDGIIPVRPTIQTTTLEPTLSTTPLPIEIGFSFLLGREIKCPKGVYFVPCPFDPCERSCAKHPESICLVNHCGTCEAKHIDLVGNILDCYDPETYCTTGEPIFDCGGEDLCSGTSCPAFPRAVCVPNRCGGCYYDFVDGKGNLVNCEIEVQSSCGYNVAKLDCEPPPCTDQVCAADITAECMNIDCGECRAEFYNVFGNIINCNSSNVEPVICQDPCDEDPCTSTICRAYPDSECILEKTYTCGKCKPSFRHKGTLLRPIDCVIPNECQGRFKCDRDPCQLYTCPGRDVICIAQYCNGCDALFFDKRGKPLRQEDCYEFSSLNLKRCPDGTVSQLCPADLCIAQKCGNDYSPICKPNECKNCELEFFNQEGDKIDCNDYIVPECENGNKKLKCETGMCKNKTCPGHPEATCTADSCNNCKLSFVDSNMKEVQCFVNDPIASHISPSPCPSGQQWKDCSNDLCNNVVCESNPNAICKANPCNECELMFFSEIGKRIDCDIQVKGTCKDNCGNFHNMANKCHCDYECKNKGDCCDDYIEICESCKDNCGLYQSFATCQCTSDCRLKNNCCSDFAEICLTTKKCKGQCRLPWRNRDICQCHPRCITRKNCCADYMEECT